MHFQGAEAAGPSHLAAAHREENQNGSGVVVPGGRAGIVRPVCPLPWEGAFPEVVVLD